ncbi:GmrSD restriction endonuclease domain-containing protein [Arthrobacter sedimenti]|uniref:GmrSD restriction endonuclease domain-containing protein n=1 Tax=Arthrobacter sedimenti TaxID=2694931 RepID=UPI000B356B35|nr:DUF262 domain-containing protein [Arthrobacter sedimenti]OUM41064.1 hypothetical protein B8W73_12005 [Arthrobacter agilis]
MATTSFRTNPYQLHDLLKDCDLGKLQLPDFQRSWVWDEDRIKSLIASVSLAFPIGALMTLDTGGGIEFKPRIVEGAPSSSSATSPDSLLLDGQQRMTSLYQVTLRNQVVRTVTPKKKRVDRWFYIDIDRAMDESFDRESAIIGVPETRILKGAFGRDIELDLSTQQAEFKQLMYPVSAVFRWDDWSSAYLQWALEYPDFKERWAKMAAFKTRIIDNFDKYQVPVIALDKSTSKEAVCVVFEKVNTGGKALDAFELITAMYAAEGHELRKDWYGGGENEGRHRRLARAYRSADQAEGILAKVTNTDFLQVVSLFHTRDRRLEAVEEGKSGKELPQITGNRQALLNLPLASYLKYENLAEEGFRRAAKFLHMLHIYRIYDLPYQSQLIPLAAILADLGASWEHEANRAKLVRWYWNGVFGELYGSTIDTLIAKDFQQVPAWLAGGPEPETVANTVFNSNRLKTMRMRLSAAYKGMNALLMLEGARDFRTSQGFDHTVFFGENVDIHHIFPKKWCETNGIPPRVYDSIINKTPLSYRTNRIIGGVAPSRYLEQLERGNSETPPIARQNLDEYLTSHLIDPELLRTDNFAAFIADRQLKLVSLIERATGNRVFNSEVSSLDEELDDDAAEAEMTS